MKQLTVILLLLFSLFITVIKGQVNSMLNFSFEQHSSCLGFGECKTIKPVTSWYNPTNATPDWMNPICHTGSFGMPQNYVGYQYAMTGLSYAGIGFDSNSTIPYREYITGTFSDSLKPNKKYCIEFFVSLADSMWHAASALGAYLSNDSICFSSSQTILPYTPQVENPSANIITDKINWVPVSGEYLASGGEIFITIGNFYSDSLTMYTYVGGGGKGYSGVISYYYIDDVSVRELTVANAGISASRNNQKIDTICVGDTVQIGKDSTTPGVSFHWLPAAGLSKPNIAQPKASPITTTTYTLTVVNDSIHNCNCADSVTRDSVEIVVNRCGLGVQQLSVLSGQLSVEPNPNSGVFSIQSSVVSGQFSVEVFNVFGQEVYNGMLKQVQHDYEINLSAQPNGVYFYRVLKENSIPVGQGKIIIEK